MVTKEIMKRVKKRPAKATKETKTLLEEAVDQASHIGLLLPSDSIADPHRRLELRVAVERILNRGAAFYYLVSSADARRGYDYAHIKMSGFVVRCKSMSM